MKKCEQYNKLQTYKTARKCNDWKEYQNCQQCQEDYQD